MTFYIFHVKYILRFDRATYLKLLFKFILFRLLQNSLWGLDILLFLEFINIVSILFYNFLELLNTFLIISFARYKKYMICVISFGKFSVVLLAFTCARAIGHKKGPSISFSPVTFTNVELSPYTPKTFWPLVLTFLPHWCKISRSYLAQIPNYWTWTKTTLEKTWFFWSNPYEFEVMIISLIEMLELPNFDHMTTPTT